MSNGLTKITLIAQNVLLGAVLVASLGFSVPQGMNSLVEMYLNILWSVSFVIMLAASVYRWRQLSILSWEKDRADVFAMLFVVLTAAIVRLKGLGDFGVWFDEDDQIQFLLLNKHPVVVALKAFQSPLDYILNSIFLKIGGADLFVARFWSASMGAFAALMVYILVRTQARVWVALAAAFMAVFHPWLLAYSRECRPYIGSVFLFGLTLQWLWWCWENQRQRHVWLGAAVSMVVLFFYSAILPVIMLGIFGLILLRSWHEKRGFVQGYWVIFILALLLWLPYYLLMASHHQVGDAMIAVWSLEVSNYFARVWSALSVSAAGLVLVAAVLIKKGGTPFPRLLMGLALAYPLGMMMFSSPGVHIYFAERFLLLYSFLVLVVIGLAAENVISYSKSRWIHAGVAVGFVSSIVYFWQMPSVKLENRAWNEAYSIFEQEKDVGGIAVVFSPAPLNHHGVTWFLGEGLIFNKQSKIALSTNRDERLGQTGMLIKTLSENQSAAYLYLFSYRAQHVKMWNTLPIESLYGVQRHALSNGSTLLRVDMRDEGLSRLQTLFETIRRHHNNEEIDIRYKEVLLGVALLRQDCMEAKKYGDVLKQQMRLVQDVANQRLLQELQSQKCS